MCEEEKPPQKPTPSLRLRTPWLILNNVHRTLFYSALHKSLAPYLYETRLTLHAGSFTKKVRWTFS